MAWRWQIPEGVIKTGRQETLSTSRRKLRWRVLVEFMARMARSEKDARWLGIRMENFVRLQGRQTSEPGET